MMDDRTLKAILGDAITRADDFKDAELVPGRLKADRYYKGQPFGNEVDGESQVVSRDVAEAVDAMLPALLKMFSSGPAVMFEATKPGGEQAAEQATEYVNYIVNIKNSGFQVHYGWFKDALLKKRGFVKVWSDDREEVDASYYKGLVQPEIELLRQDKTLELEIEPGESLDPAIEQFDVTAKRMVKRREIMIANVPHDEILIDPLTGDTDETPFIAHRVLRTMSDLMAQGYDAEKLERVGMHQEIEEERAVRFGTNRLVDDLLDTSLDDTLRKIEITECYLKVDYDDDGIAEMRKITVAGSGTVIEILENEPCDDHPFASLCPFPSPHAFWGESVFDKTRDVQEGKSVLTRQILNNLYLTNQPRFGLVDGQVNIDDMLSSQNQLIRITRPDAIVPIITNKLDSGPYNMLQMWDVVREQRTGVRRMASGPGADSLQNAYTETLGGSEMVADASAERIELIARIFAETGVKRMMRLVLKEITKYDNKPKIARLRGVWTPINPAEWDSGMDMSIAVGLGSGNHQKDAATMMALIGLDQQLIALQGGVDGPLLTLENLYAKLSRLVAASGLKSVERYYSDPKLAPPKPPAQPPVDPNILLAQAQMKIDADKLAADMKKHEQKLLADMQQHQADLEAEMQRFAADLQVKRAIEAEKNAVALEKARIDSETDVQTTLLKIGADENAANMKHRHEAGLAGQQFAAIDEDIGPSPEMAAINQIGETLRRLADIITAPKSVVRDENGQAAAVRIDGFPDRPIVRDENGEITGLA